MATLPSDVRHHRFTANDGVELAYHEMGEGRPVVLIHGFFSNAATNWVRYGHAERLADAGFRVIMPDLRAHGDSAKPHDPTFYPPDVLADDGFALIEHLGLTDYDLGGYSLGGRTTLRMLVRGATPRRSVMAGIGFSGIIDTQGRGKHFRHILTNLGTFERGTDAWMAEAFLKTTGGDPVALLNILDTFVDTPIDAIRSVEIPTIVISGTEDNDNGSGEELAGTLAYAHYQSIPGNHMSAVTKPELGMTIAEFLATG